MNSDGGRGGLTLGEVDTIQVEGALAAAVVVMPIEALMRRGVVTLKHLAVERLDMDLAGVSRAMVLLGLEEADTLFMVNPVLRQGTIQVSLMVLGATMVRFCEAVLTIMVRIALVTEGTNRGGILGMVARLLIGLGRREQRVVHVPVLMLTSYSRQFRQ
jgi:hypothetical protein